MTINYTEYIAFKATPAERQKLEMLAQQTGRRISQVLRLLIAQAEMSGEPDIKLRQKASRADGCHVECGQPS